MSARATPEDLLAIAHITRPHGIRGEVNAIALAPPILDARALVAGRRLYARDAKGRVWEIEGVALRHHQNRWLIELAGVETVDDAEALRKVDLCLPREELPPLPEGWFWEDDLARCQVVDRTMGPLGTVERLDIDGFHQAQLVLRRPDGARVSIPWVCAYITEVNLDTHEIAMDLPRGIPGLEE